MVTFADGYNAQLWRHQGPRDWLEARGLDLKSPPLLEAKLGYVSEPLDPAHARFKGSIVIPYFDARGRERKIRFRDPHPRPGSPKYWDLPGQHPHLYGVQDVTAASVYVAEGEFDRLILKILGHAAVGIAGGLSGWVREWRWLFRDADLVSVVLDEDPTGDKGTGRIKSQLTGLTNVRVVELPPGRDVNELYLSNPDDLKRRLQ